MGKLKDELLNVECEQFGKKIPLLDYIYIIPTRRKHDSGYMCMEIIGANENGYKKKLATYSDVIDLQKVLVSNNRFYNLSIDIPEYGVIRLFNHTNKFKVGFYGISSFTFDIVEIKEQE